MDIKIKDIKSVSMKLASPDNILGWSYGEVTKPETINYRTQRAERNGLFDERIFGPEKDYECYCGKYRRIRYKGIICEKCGVEVTKSIVRRERMGHIALAVPVAHIWFMKSIPSRIALLLDITAASVEKVVYLTGYIVTSVDDARKAETKKQITAEYKMKLKNLTTDDERESLKEATAVARAEVDSITVHNVLDEIEYFNLSKKYGDIFDVGIGAEALYNIFVGMDLEMEQKNLETQMEGAGKAESKRLERKLKLIKSMRSAGVRPEWMFLTVLPVIPPAIRPMVALDGGRHATSDVNDLYRRVINRNNRLKRLIEIGAPEVICRNEKRILQEAVDALLDNSIRQGSAVSAIGRKRTLKSIADMLRGKSGRFRQNLLGKRVDYSGRSVIVVGPELTLDECGLPKHMALELFRPFVISKLIKNELAFNIRGAGRLIEEGIPEVWAILEEIIKDKHVLLNRAPTLHRLGIQAFRPILIEGKAVQVHPLVCAAFNADFDGDQMAVHVPLSDKAQGEARDIIASTHNLLRPGNGEPIVNPEKEIILGCYWMTQIEDGARGEGQYFSSPNEAIMAYDFGEVNLRAMIKVMKTDAYKYSHFIDNHGVFETTVGRLLFNSVFPDDFQYVNDQLNKGRLSDLVELLIDKYGIQKTSPILDAIKHFGFEYATRSGISWGIDDLQLPKQKTAIVAAARSATQEIDDNFAEGLLTDEERYRSFIEIWQHAKDQVEDAVPEALDQNGSVYALVNSKARGSWSQVAQMSGMKGLMLNPSGRVIDFPVVSSYKEGLGVLEYFITTHGARKGEADTALRTAKAGYLTRRLVSVADDVIVLEESCSDEKGIAVTRKDIEEYGKTFRSTVFGRTLASDTGKFKKGYILTQEDIVLLEADTSIEEIRIFSPMTCNAHTGACQKCYGYDLGYNQMVRVGVPVGVVAAQAIGEPGTQLTLRTFHAGGIATGGDITMGLPRVEELFELRTIKNPAVLCREQGEVMSIEHVDNVQKITVLRDTPGTTKGASAKSGKNKESDEYIIPFRRTPIVQKGSLLSVGDIMTDGSVDVRDYFKLAGEEKTRQYIMNEIGKVYTMQGAAINDKHFEVVIKKMLSKVQIVDPGDSKFARGVTVSESDVIRENARLEADAREPAKTAKLITPISKVPLYSASFLSAAAFQDTTRVLIKAALSGIEDTLKGLRENVIIGNLIPTGTGLKLE